MTAGAAAFSDKIHEVYVEAEIKTGTREADSAMRCPQVDGRKCGLTDFSMSSSLNRLPTCKQLQSKTTIKVYFNGGFGILPCATLDEELTFESWKLYASALSRETSI